MPALMARPEACDSASGSTQQVGWSGPAHAAGACSRDALLLGPSDELPGRDVVLEGLACRMAAVAGDGRAVLSLTEDVARRGEAYGGQGLTVQDGS